MSVDIHQYLAELEDIPGTRVFTTSRARQGYWLNQFCMTLMKAENRARFKADERAYLDEWPMTEKQKQAILDRDYNAALDEGGNIYFLAKVFFIAQPVDHAPRAYSALVDIIAAQFHARIGFYGPLLCFQHFDILGEHSALLGLHPHCEA